MTRGHCACLALALLTFAVRARADGRMMLRDRELFREGPAARGYCDAASSGSPEECDRVLSKVLSGYTYVRGHLSGGVAFDQNEQGGVGALHISSISADLPGGAIALAAFDGVMGDAATRRLRITLVDTESLFVCHDAQTGALVAPIVGMFTRECLPDARIAVDIGLLAMQWDFSTDRLIAEWIRFGPALELLGNGFGYAHLAQSIMLGLPFDLRSVRYSASQPDGETSLGVGLRVSAFYRSPQWEIRGVVRQRTSLAGGAGFTHDNSVDGELRFVHNFFLTDRLVVQAGVSLRAAWSQRPENTFVAWTSTDRSFASFAGLHLGWVHEAPDI